MNIHKKIPSAIGSFTLRNERFNIISGVKKQTVGRELKGSNKDGVLKKW